jgi:EmrB/QacA subfamily drug resistance transporter
MNPTKHPARDRLFQWLALFSICFGQFMTAVDTRAVLVALPTISHDLHTDLASVQWVILAQQLTVIGLMLTLGRLGDLMGRKKMYNWGFFFFTVFSILCAVSRSMGQLVAFRVLGGVAAAMLTANGRALATTVFPSSERGKALGFTSMAFHLGFLTGPSVGGLLIDHVGWRGVFLINAPFGILATLMAIKFIHEPVGEKSKVSLDLPGALLLLVGTGSLILALNRSNRLGFSSPVILGLLWGALVAFFLFVRTEKKSLSPILSLSLFRIRLFTVGSLSLFFISTAQSAINFLMPFYLQGVKGFTATQMGLTIITNSVVIVMVAPIGGTLSDRLGSRLLCTVGAASIAVAQYFLGSLSVDSSLLRIVWPLVLAGFGWAIFNSPNNNSVFGSVPKSHLGAVGGMMATTSSIGNSIGVAISGLLFLYSLEAAGVHMAAGAPVSAWLTSKEAFARAFNQTARTVNLMTVCAILASAVKGTEEKEKING